MTRYKNCKSSLIKNTTSHKFKTCRLILLPWCTISNSLSISQNTLTQLHMNRPLYSKGRIMCNWLYSIGIPKVFWHKIQKNEISNLISVFYLMPKHPLICFADFSKMDLLTISEIHWLSFFTQWYIQFWAFSLKIWISKIFCVL